MIPFGRMLSLLTTWAVHRFSVNTTKENSMSPRSTESIVPHSALINPNAAGIDVGATELYVAVPTDRCEKPVRCFSTFTQDVHALAEWLKSCKVSTVAMESTGVYWIPVFQILADHGLTVCLVNARHVKNVPGRKTDVTDCQWLQFLHSVGLLRGSFRPPQQVCALRTILRHRDAMIKLTNVHIQHMQKAMTQMNIQLHNVISDITGTTGLAIIDAILAGERDPETLAAFRDARVKSSCEIIAKSLVGDYRPELLFTLRQSLESYRHLRRQIVESDETIKSLLANFDSCVDVEEKPLPDTQKKRRKKDDPHQMRQELYRITGVDLTEIPGLQTTSAYTILAEIGHDVSSFSSAKHFASWMGLCPNNRVSGGRVLSSHTKPVASRAAAALRMAATTLLRSQTALGHYYRRMRTRLGAPQAITATAHKLARIIYQMLKTKTPFNQTLQSEYEQQNIRRRQIRLETQAKSLGFALVPL